ncbi:phosphoesterase RecJ domain-containing protein [Malonomonas rubra DSM 5091]|uniref:Phosphoesterase RecJ domain-containing protein n=1 Tax=Malonomonas rubra DSM 5091 TaxID=1122189 RepID=A0A1M6KGV4_MALRU|nr:bifunctional oligoribonuclease/PAP phosphatase NrnA [Malonomonas rubra]SHJ58175.1 phosphoesterase RecJ domain-containing protein [Malonomonas rubra DSM 5091]
MIQQIVDLIEANTSFLVVAHENPDGDAIGSTLGLANALREMGKDVVALNVDGVPQIMQFLPGFDQLVTTLPENKQFDVAFVLDSGDLVRAGVPVQECCKALVNIDHHPHSEFGDICYVDTTASATAVLIDRVLQQCDYRMSLDVAKPLYLGILSDTGSFRYSSANPEAFSVAGRLVGMGIDPWEIASCLYESLAPERMKLLGLVLPTLEISDCGRYASVAMTEDILKQSGASEEHTDGFVNYPRAIRGVEVALFFRQIGADAYKISMRSRGTIDVGAMARELGGGGHHNAAGAKVNGSLEEARATVSRLLDRLI